MGLFNKLKNIISKKEQEEVVDENVLKYDEGLEKTRKEFVSKLSMLGIKYTKEESTTKEDMTMRPKWKK